MIPYGRHALNESDIEAVVSVLASDWLTTGPEVQKFEEKLSEIVQSQCISVSSGTAALHCAYAAIDIEPGDEIITPPITFIATQATAAMFGAKIVFADVDPQTATIMPEAVEAAVTTRTKAIVAVDYAGHPAEMNELREIADKRGLFLIEDAAHSIGSTYRGRPVGSIADLTTFSFFPTKNMTTGEGGAVSSSERRLLEKAQLFGRQGMIRDPMGFRILTEGPWHQEVQEFGLNYRLPDILCALGTSQLSRLASFKEVRRKIFGQYCSFFKNESRVILPTEREYVDSNWHLFPIRVQKKKRREIFQNLRAVGIGVQVNYLPAYRHPVFNDYGINSLDFPNSEEYYQREISLPIHPNLKESEVEFICETLSSFL
jgi:UDP-4-amino-4,6-dideoxy-N-acetyl-beta-L-altrosamine transaminase